MCGINTAIIVGGGIGGLTAAIALQLFGVEVTVLERTKTFQEIGAGLWLWKNAMSALELLGLGDQIRNASVQDAHGGIRNSRGDILVSRIPNEHDHVSVAILRSDLQKTLLTALNPQFIQTNSEYVDFAQDPQGVTVYLGDGRELRSDILIGADGIRSRVRAKMFGLQEPIYAGFTAWRAVTRYAPDKIPSGVFWGYGARFGVMPVINDRVNWFAGRKMPEGMSDSPDGRKKELFELFRDWYEPIPTLIEATNAEDIIRNDIYRGQQLRYWTKGRVTLVGDSAHAMTPSIGQGACQAIEDALDLALCVHEEKEPVAALLHYESRRIRRTAAVSHYAQLMDSVGLWENPTVCRVRNFVIKHAPGAVRDQQLKWILSYQAGR